MKRYASVFLLFLALAPAATAQLPQPRTPWEPPIGIPAPPFGITEVAGTPTHYVDNTHPSATDSSNPNGTPTRPRATVPTVLAAGSVVEVRGGPYTLGSVAWTANGTAQSPVHIKGVGMPVFNGASSGRIAAVGSYFIIDGLVLNNVPLVFASGVHHFSLRRSILRNFSPSVNASAIYPVGTDMVFYGNEIHNNGDPNSNLEVDIHAIKPDTGSNRIWIVDNHIHHNGGDAVQIGNVASAEPWPQFIYIGRNVIHEDRENAVDVKRARDVIVSQNVMYGYVPRSSSSGAATVAHNNPQRVWIVANRVALSVQGIVSTGADGYFVIGNIIHNISHLATDTAYDPNNMYQSAGIITYNTTNSYHINNTLYAVDAGISYPSGTVKTEIVNNIIGGLQQPSHHVGFGSTTQLSLSVFANNLVDATARIKVSGGINSCSGFTACLNADPRFIDAANSSFDLRGDSPAVDVGVTHPLYALFQSTYGISLAFDAKGAPRPLGRAFDLGALEATGGPAPPSNLRIIR